MLIFVSVLEASGSNVAGCNMTILLSIIINVDCLHTETNQERRAHLYITQRHR